MSSFQTILLTLFGLLILAGVLFFAGYGPTAPGSTPSAELVLWGTVPESVLSEYFRDWNDVNSDTATITYVYHDENQIEADLLQALATGRGPDLILLSSGMLVRQSDKLYPVSYDQYSARTFLDTFVDGGSLFTSSAGIYALPLVADPIVMYWNKDLFAAAGVAKPPQYWDEMATLVPKLIEKDAKGNIVRAAVGLGGYRNIDHAREILASLFFQVGDPIAESGQKEQGIFSRTTLGKTTTTGPSPTESALRFYTQFGNPADPTYSWNRGLANSRELFVSGELAIYFGTASEFGLLSRQNPNLSFDVAPMPTIRPAANTPRNKNVAGEMIGIAVLAATQYPTQSFAAASLFSETDWNRAFAGVIGLPPLRRDLIAEGSKDPYVTIFNQAALSVRSWPDPSPAVSNSAFRDMVDSVLTGVSPSAALNTAYEILEAAAQ